MQKRKKLLWRIYPSYLLITLISLMIVVWHASKSLRQFRFEHMSCDLKGRALLVKRLFEEKAALWPVKESKSRLRVDALCRELGPQISTRITFILPSGDVIGDSQEDISHMGNQISCPEFRAALTGKVGISTRYDFELKKEVMHVAIPVEREEGSPSSVADRKSSPLGAAVEEPFSPRPLSGIIRLSVPLTSSGQILKPVYLKIAFGALLLAVVAAVISLIISRPIDIPIREMEEGVNHFASGDLDYRLSVSRSEEMGVLGETINRMAARVGERIRSITQQKNELETVLSSMHEAVLVIDMNERIARFNQAAAYLFDVAPASAQGRSIQEVIRNTDLQRLIAQTLSSEESQEAPMAVEGDIVLYNGNGTERFLQAHGTILKDVKGVRVGVLIVLNDITRLKVLENVRRDFVANVSHELKTPITSIKGFVETLREGAIDFPEDRMRFLDIIARHADRLNAIIEDLLSLSRIEQEAEREQIALEEGSIKEVLDSAILVCAGKAHEKQIQIDLACDESLKAKINLPLLEQAVVNLIDNAIKYSEPESAVRIEAARTGTESVALPVKGMEGTAPSAAGMEGAAPSAAAMEGAALSKSGEIVIKVRDWGCGIPKEHLTRIFERFYRVDKARSRKLGGTGLGLAIVKHIVHAHGGRILVESAPAKGSTFSIYLPPPFTSL